MDTRIENEIKFGIQIVENNGVSKWNWDSAAGIERKNRRAKMLSESIKQNMSILEVGCGTGIFTREFLKTNSKITAIDISPDLLDIAQNQISSENVQFKLINAYDTKFDNESFDGIIGSSVLHHLELKKALNEFYRVLKPGGFISFTEPNMLNPQIFFERKFRFLFDNVTPDEIAFIRKILLRDVEDSGFINTEIYPFDWLHPKTPKRLIGFVSNLGVKLESIPVLKEFAGSVFLRSYKPTA